VIRIFHDRLIQGGYLFIGHAESLARIEHNLRYVMPGLYSREDGANWQGLRPLKRAAVRGS
ncbi:MAG: hypothetical protein V2A77_11800, partial [Pseudomonadota bacterium]